MGQSTDEFQELDEDHVLGAPVISLHILHSDFGETIARGNLVLRDLQILAQLMLLGSLLHHVDDPDGLL